MDVNFTSHSPDSPWDVFSLARDVGEETVWERQASVAEGVKADTLAAAVVECEVAPQEAARDSNNDENCSRWITNGPYMTKAEKRAAMEGQSMNTLDELHEMERLRHKRLLKRRRRYIRRRETIAAYELVHREAPNTVDHVAPRGTRDRNGAIPHPEFSGEISALTKHCRAYRTMIPFLPKYELRKGEYESFKLCHRPRTLGIAMDKNPWFGTAVRPREVLRGEQKRSMKHNFYWNFFYPGLVYLRAHASSNKLGIDVGEGQ